MKEKNRLSPYENREDVKNLKGEYFYTLENAIEYLDKKEIPKELRELMIEDLIKRLNYGQAKNKNIEVSLGTKNVYNFIDQALKVRRHPILKVLKLLGDIFTLSSLVFTVNMAINLFGNISKEKTNYILNGRYLFYAIFIPIQTGIYKAISKNMGELSRKLTYIFSILAVFVVYLGIYRLGLGLGLAIEALKIQKSSYIFLTLLLSILSNIKIEGAYID